MKTEAWMEKLGAQDAIYEEALELLDAQPASTTAASSAAAGACPRNCLDGLVIVDGQVQWCSCSAARDTKQRLKGKRVDLWNARARAKAEREKRGMTKLRPLAQVEEMLDLDRYGSGKGF